MHCQNIVDGRCVQKEYSICFNNQTDQEDETEGIEISNVNDTKTEAQTFRYRS